MRRASSAASNQRAARDLLFALSYRASKEFEKRGGFHYYLWLTEDALSVRTWLEWEWNDGDNSDAEALATLRVEMRADMARDGIERYAVAFPAAATVVLRESILHLTGKEVRQEVICIEAHDGNVHLRAQREVRGSCLAALAAVEAAPGVFGDLC